MAARLLELVWLMLPTYCANMAPPFVKFWRRWNRPIHRSLLGNHKTVVGFSLGVMAAVGAAFLQSRISSVVPILWRPDDWLARDATENTSLRQENEMPTPSHTSPRMFVVYRPFTSGVRCALFYFESGPDVYGWWIGARRSRFYAAYFKLEDCFTTRSTRFYATGGMDLYGGWRFLYSARTAALAKPVQIEQEAAHELNRLQGIFAAEWLFFEDDPGSEAERDTYRRMKLPLRRVNIRSDALNRLTSQGPEWRYQSHDFNPDVLDYLQRHWPLDYRNARKPRPGRLPAAERAR